MPDHATTAICPPLADLERLIHGRCTDARNAALCEHVGACPECQKRLDRLAGSGSGLAERLREAEDEPPKNSAYWKALAYAEDELRKTVVFQPGGRTTDASDGTELELDFLQPADKPDLLGKLGRFDIVRVVGRGGMGVVLHGYDPALRSMHALFVAAGPAVREGLGAGAPRGSCANSPERHTTRPSRGRRKT